MASITAADVNNSSCGVTSLSLNTTDFVCANIGANTVTLTVTNSVGNTGTCDATITVEDNISPDLTCPADATVSNDAGNCNAAVVYSSPTATDPLVYSTQGTFTVTWTYDDGNGNTSSQAQTVIVDDVTAPVADAATLADATGECSVTLTAPTATDNCEGSITATTTDPTSYSTQGTFSVTWTYDDGNGNTSSQVQTVIVDDVTAPVVDVATLAEMMSQRQRQMLQHFLMRLVNAA